MILLLNFEIITDDYQLVCNPCELSKYATRCVKLRYRVMRTYGAFNHRDC